jgi:putative membrane protein
MVAWFGGGWGGGPWIGIVYPGESAAAALGERYARGEIDEDEYRKRLRVLRER